MEPINSSVNISTKRTGVNVAVLSGIVGLIAKITNWDVSISAEDLAILAPVLGVVVAIGYRLSRAVTTKWPQVGWVLFGSGVEPAGTKPIGS